MIAEVNGISKRIKNKMILDNITFSLKSNEVVALVGPNGSGKTTLLKTMVGLLKLDGGTIKIFGLNTQKNREQVLSKLSFMQDSSVLYPNLTGYDHLHFIAKINKQKQESIQEMIKKLKIESYIHKKVEEYSMGMKQHLLLAIALLNKPQLRLLDEPLNGLDPSSNSMLRELILKLRSQGTSILFSSHVLGEVDKVADRILFIKEGKIISENYMDTSNSNKIYIFRISPIEMAIEILTPQVVELVELDNNKVQITIQSLGLNKVLKTLYDNKIEIYDIEEMENGAESIYHNLYGEKNDD